MLLNHFAFPSYRDGFAAGLGLGLGLGLAVGAGGGWWGWCGVGIGVGVVKERRIQYHVTFDIILFSGGTFPPDTGETLTETRFIFVG